MQPKRILPPEWHPQGAVLLTWPHRGTDWSDRLETVTPVFEAIAHAILKRENLLVSCEDVFGVDRLQKQFDHWCREGKLPGRARVLLAPANDTWARDHGPITILEDGEPRVLNFVFNGWGGKYPSDKDNAITRHLVRQRAFGGNPIVNRDLVLEGGSIESDGQGTLLTTRQCLLSPTRNPDLDEPAITARLREWLGVERILWLDHGHLDGDDTDGHIDTLARFCSPRRICYQACTDPADSHFEPLSRMADQLRLFTDPVGQPYELIPLPWPEPVFGPGGERLPATYANFLIINEAVLVPVYGLPQDAKACETLGQCFPDRVVEPIDCRPLLEQHGSLHCLTMQIPREVWQA